MQSTTILREACVNSYHEARIAVEKGADRIELCANMQEGGTTPSYGTILKSLALGKPIVVMIRPKGGNFVYDEEEIDLMKHDIRICKQLGVQEVVFGALKESNQINIEVMRQLIAESQPMDVVFHMAFDSLIDQEKGFEQLQALKVKRLLTRGGVGSAWDNRERIKQWIEKYSKTIEILPGGGVTYENYQHLAAYTGATQVHGTKIMS